MDWSKVTQPTLILDKEICLRNIENMCKKTEATKVSFRPHFKTHQSRAVGEYYRQFGVDAITVSSVHMAEYFAVDGWNDITIAFPFNPREWEKIKQLAEKNHIHILISNLESAHIISQKTDIPLGVFIEVDAGYHRSGIPANKINEILTVAEIILQNNNIRLEGILSHFGNSYSEPSEKINQLWNYSLESLNKVKSALSDSGTIKISVGDTPCCSVINDFSGVDEIRPGNFVFYDVMQASKGICKTNDIALAVACPVVDLHPERNEFVIYGGGIHLSKEFIFNESGERNYGLICNPTSTGWSEPVLETYIKSLSQEHGIVKTTTDFIQTLKIGDLVLILPVHSCLTAQCYSFYLTLDGDVLDHLNYIK